MNRTCPTCALPVVVADPNAPRVNGVHFCTNTCVARWYASPLHDRRRSNRNVRYERRAS